MGKRLAISILAFFISCTAFGAGTARKSLLRDGFVLAGVDGKLTFQDTNEGSQRWLFEFYSDVSDDIGIIKAGVSLEILPSTTLEKMTDDMEKRSDASSVRSKSAIVTAETPVQTSNGSSYRLWGIVTKCNGRNFIFPDYFLPISEVKQAKSQSQQAQPQKPDVTINDPNDALAIPQEIIAKLETRRIVRPEQLRKGLALKADCILADRTGFIHDSGARARGTGHEVSLVLDALGRNVQQISFRLLPCQVLEQAQRIQSAEPDPMRFKIAGIVTKYKGENYLLLQRAIRAYSHQNFGR